MTEIPKTMTEAAALLRAGELTSEALTEACFAVADRLDAELGTYIARYDETALAAAKLADEELAAGIDKGPLHGMPIGINGFLAGGWKITLLQMICVLVGCLVYYPFVKLLDKKMSEDSEEEALQFNEQPTAD